MEPESKDCQSSVKIYLTNSSPSAITLQANRVYFDTQRGVYSSLHFACEVKRFHGVLKLRINTEAGQLEIKVPGQSDDVQYVRAKLQRLDNVVQGVITWDTMDRIQHQDLREKQTRDLLAVLLQKPQAEDMVEDRKENRKSFLGKMSQKLDDREVVAATQVIVDTPLKIQDEGRIADRQIED
nr:hypothetical protein BaRGS_035259 [Batillaria attramentaria]